MALNKIFSSVDKVRNVLALAQTTVSKMPDLTNATKTNIVALTRQQEAKNVAVPDSLRDISNKLKQQETSNSISTELSNFKPEIIDNVIQRRRSINTQVETGDSRNRSTGRSNAKKNLLKGVDPLTQQTAQAAKDIVALGLEKTKLTSQLNKTEAQITALAAKIQALTNTDATGDKIRQYQDKLEEFSNKYDQIKLRLEQINELYKQRHELWRKLRRKKQELQKKFSDNYDKFLKLLNKFREIPRKLKMPKLPKLPTFNVRKSNLRMKIRDLVDKIKKASQKASKVALEQSREQAKEKIRDPKKGDAFQKAMANTRKAFAEAVARYDSVIAAKNAAIDTVTNQAFDQIRRVRSSVNKAQRQIEAGIDTAAASQNSKVLKIREAQQKAKRLRDATLNKIDSARSLVDRAASGIQSAQNVLNGQLVGADIKSSAVVNNMTVAEKERTDLLNANITQFLNLNNINNFIVGVGKGSTLASARNMSLTLDRFKAQYPTARYDVLSRIANIDGVYIVVTVTYEKPVVARLIQPPLVVNNTVITTPTPSTTNTPTSTPTGTTTTPTPTGTTPTPTPTGTTSTPTPTAAPISNGAPIPTPTPMVERAPTSTPTTTKVQSGNKILIVGDSITADLYQNQKTSTWSVRFKDSRKDFNVEIMAIGGKLLTNWMKPELFKRLDAGNRYNKIVIYGGVNDMFSGPTPQQALTALQAMVDKARSTGAQVVVVTGYDTANDMNVLKYPRRPYNRNVDANGDRIITDEDLITKVTPLKNKYIQYQQLIQTRLTGATVVPPVRVGELSDGVHPYGRQVTTLLNHISPYI